MSDNVKTGTIMTTVELFGYPFDEDDKQTPSMTLDNDGSVGMNYKVMITISDVDGESATATFGVSELKDALNKFEAGF